MFVQVKAEDGRKHLADEIRLAVDVSPSAEKLDCSGITQLMYEEDVFMAKIISRNFRGLCDFMDIYQFMIDI